MPLVHPGLDCKLFRAPCQFCEAGQVIPILFRGSEQLGEAALQVLVSDKTPVSLVQAALLHQCDEVAKAIHVKTEEIHALERYVADACTACFHVGVGDLQIGLLSAGIAPPDLCAPSIPCDSQETGVQALVASRSTCTQDGVGLDRIDRKLQDCVLHPTSTEIMDEYMEDWGYELDSEGSHPGHSFHKGPWIVKAVADRFQTVPPMAVRGVPDSEIQDLRNLDCESSVSRPFRGVHFLLYTDDQYPICLPTQSTAALPISRQLSKSCCVIEPPPIEPLIASSITHDSFLLSSEAVPSAQLQTPVYLNTHFLSLWASLL